MMRQAKLLILLIVLVMLPATIITAQQPSPSLEVLNLMRPDDLHYDFLVEVNQTCNPIVLGDLGFFYMDTSEPLTLNFYPFSGYYDCTNGTLLQTYTIPYQVGELYTVVIYPDESGNPNFALFNNDLSSPSRGQARLSLRNGSSSPLLTFVLQRQEHSPAVSYTVPRGQQMVIEVPAGKWTISLSGVSVPIASSTQDELYHPGEVWAVEAADDVGSGLMIWSRQYH